MEKAGAAKAGKDAVNAESCQGVPVVIMEEAQQEPGADEGRYASHDSANEGLRDHAAGEMNMAELPGLFGRGCQNDRLGHEQGKACRCQMVQSPHQPTINGGTGA